MRPECGLRLAVDADPQDAVRRLQPIFWRICNGVEQWMDEQPKTLLDEPRLRGSVAFLERYDDLLDGVAWVRKAIERDGGITLARSEWEVGVTVAGFVAASRQAAPGVVHDWRGAVRVLTAIWSPGLDRRDDVNAPQVAVASLGGGWAPGSGRGLPPTSLWEPAGIVLQAMIYKSVHRGLHSLASRHVAPLSSERCGGRGRFDAHIWMATHTIAGWLTSPDGGGRDDGLTVSSWACDERSLWELVSNAVLGPGRPGGGCCGGRPLPAAYPASLLGRWCEPAVGVRVGTVEAYVCLDCSGVCGQPRCPQHPSATVVATSLRNHFVTPRHRLADGDRAWGSEEVERAICKDEGCVQQLRRALGGHHRTCQPIYSTSATRCPYCRSTLTRQRPTRVWTRFP